MPRSQDKEHSARDLEARFAAVEKRVLALVEENKSLKGLIRALEEELEQARRNARELEHFHGRKLHIREKIEKILQELETVGSRK